MVNSLRTVPSEANLLICLSSFYHHKIIGKVLQLFRGDLLSHFFYLVLKWLKMEKITEVVTKVTIIPVSVKTFFANFYVMKRHSLGLQWFVGGINDLKYSLLHYNMKENF